MLDFSRKSEEKSSIKSAHRDAKMGGFVVIVFGQSIRRKISFVAKKI